MYDVPNGTPVIGILITVFVVDETGESRLPLSGRPAAREYYFYSFKELQLMTLSLLPSFLRPFRALAFHTAAVADIHHGR